MPVHLKLDVTPFSRYGSYLSISRSTPRKGEAAGPGDGALYICVHHAGRVGKRELFRMDITRDGQPVAVTDTCDGVTATFEDERGGAIAVCFDGEDGDTLRFAGEGLGVRLEIEPEPGVVAQPHTQGRWSVNARPQMCRAMLELCNAVGAGVMVHHPGLVPAQPPAILERLHRIERDALREMGDVAAGYGVKIAVETLFVEDSTRYTADPVKLAQVIAEIDHGQVCGTLDFSHAYIMTTLRGMDYRDALRAFAPCTNHLHVHDSFGRPTSDADFYSHAERIAFGMGDLHLPMGWGDIGWETILPELACRPGTVMIVELPPRHMAELHHCAATARRFAEIVNQAHRQAA